MKKPLLTNLLKTLLTLVIFINTVDERERAVRSLSKFYGERTECGNQQCSVSLQCKIADPSYCTKIPY